MKRGDLVHVDVNLVVNLMGKGGAPFGIYLGEFRDPQYGTFAQVLLASGKIMNLHFTHLRAL